MNLRKNAAVTSIYKDDGGINDKNNYRPIVTETFPWFSKYIFGEIDKYAWSNNLSS